MEGPRDALEVSAAGQHLEPRDDRHRHAGLTARLHVGEVVLVLEEHLGDDVLGAGLHLLQGAADVGLEVGRLEVLLGIAGAPHAELGRRRVQVLVEVLALVHALDLADQIGRVDVASAPVAERLPVALVVAADGQDVVDAQEAELDEEVLGLLLGEAMAEDVGDRVDLVLVLNQRADTEGARPLALDVPLDSVRGLLVDDLRRMAGDVDEGRRVLLQIVHQREDVAHVVSPLRRDDLEADGRARRPGEMFGDLHRSSPDCHERGAPATKRTARQPC